MKDTTTKHNEYTARETKASLYAAFWALAWGLSVACSVAILKFLPESKTLFGLTALLINVAIGFATILAYTRLLKTLDEMLRKIWIESMAMTLGALCVAFGGLLILDAAGFHSIGSLEIGLLTMLAALGLSSGAVRALK